MPDQYPTLAIDAARDFDHYVVRIRGELDMAGCPALELALQQAEWSDADRILVDLEELRFADASGLSVIMNAGRRSADNGDRLRITGGKGQVARILRLTTLDDILPIADPVPAA